MNFQNLLNSLLISEQNSISLLDIFVSFTVPFFLTFFIALFYKKTSKTSSFSSEFLYSLFLFSSLTSIITLLIGSNIARAFGLVGALSLIRFRTAVKSPLDAIYLFWALGVGMACGTGFYFAAFVITVLGCLYLGFLYKLNVGEVDQIGGILKVKVSTKIENMEKIETQISALTKNLKKMNTLFDSKLDIVVHVYSFDLQKNNSVKKFHESLKEISEIESVELLNAENSLFI
jgi:uncharacterized membrane protein YhiD involved in acid resistance